MRNLFAKLVLIVFSLLLVALLLECALRVAFYHSKDFSMEMWKYAVLMKRPVSDPKLSFVHEPNTDGFLMGQDVKINSEGLRDNEYSLAKASRRESRILVLGDSTSLGWGVPRLKRQPRYCRGIECRDVPGYERFEVINSGVGNYDTVQEVTYYKTRGRDFHPDLIILAYFINDPEPVPVQRRMLADRPVLSRSLRNQSI